MILEDCEEQRFQGLLRPYADDVLALKMKAYRQHGAISTYEHCENVARVSYWLNRRLRLGADEKALVAGAFLHDFYLYDWHISESWHRLHGFSHADTACRNAREHFHVGSREQSIIRSHMWPLNLTRVPGNREAMIVCMADKYCAVAETLAWHKGEKRLC